MDANVFNENEVPDTTESFWWEMLYDADPDCEHDEQPVSGGGVKCTKCGGWFCF